MSFSVWILSALARSVCVLAPLTYPSCLNCLKPKLAVWASWSFSSGGHGGHGGRGGHGGHGRARRARRTQRARRSRSQQQSTSDQTANVPSADQGNVADLRGLYMYGNVRLEPRKPINC